MDLLVVFVHRLAVVTDVRHRLLGRVAKPALVGAVQVAAAVLVSSQVGPRLDTTRLVTFGGLSSGLPLSQGFHLLPDIKQLWSLHNISTYYIITNFISSTTFVSSPYLKAEWEPRS